jgi:FkbM family methyltransferase
MKKIVNKIIRMFEIYIMKDEFLSAHNRWLKDNGDETLRIDYNLEHNSIVFDLGGYKGDFADTIYQKYQCTIYIFEPVEEFYLHIKDRFKNNSKIKVFQVGLSNKNDSMEINVSNDSYSVFKTDGNKEVIKLEAVSEFLENNNITQIDLFKINIEGGEFDILPELIKTNFINNISNLQIQFHNFINNAEEKRDTIRTKLLNTHKETYNYYFIWEGWSLNE